MIARMIITATKILCQESEFPFIDGLRAIAATWIILYHNTWLLGFFDFWPNAPPCLMHCPLRLVHLWIDSDSMPALLTLLMANGYFAVDLFFVISGFLISNVISQNEGQDWSAFMMRRYFRIAPTQWVYCITDTQRDVLTYVATNTFWLNFLPFFFNYDGGSVAHLWSISIEMQFYAVARVLHSAARRSWIFPAAVMVLSVLTRALAVSYDHWFFRQTFDYVIPAYGVDPIMNNLDYNKSTIGPYSYMYFWPFTRISPFIAGMMASLQLKTNFIPPSPLGSQCSSILAMACIIFVMFHGSYYVTFGPSRTLAIIFAPAAFGIAVAYLIHEMACGRFHRARLTLGSVGLRILARASYGSYLYQFSALTMAQPIIDRFFTLEFSRSHALLAWLTTSCLAVSISFVFGVATLLLVEQPCVQWQKQWSVNRALT